MMNHNYIQYLLDKYMQSKTTIEEERLLKDYFQSHQDIPNEWKAFSILFNGFAGKMGLDTGSGLVAKKRSVKRVGFWIAAVAASVLIAILVMPSIDDKRANKDQSVNVADNITKASSVPVVSDSESSSAGDEVYSASKSEKHVVAYRYHKKEKKAVIEDEMMNGTNDTPKTELGRELSEDELMARYIDDNFITIEEKMRRQEAENTFSACLNSEEMGEAMPSISL